MTLSVLAPVSGVAVRLSDVPDQAFADALVGPGAAIDPARSGRGTALAPVDGTVVKLYPHAYVVRTAGGAGVLVHLGIDTVQLAGAGFELLTSENAEVRAGDPMVAWEPAVIEHDGRSPICPVIALDAQASALSEAVEEGPVAAGDVLFVWDV
ncbi:PTS sugar transporter subunit IIA [Phytoactinopolyspora halotolerans]|uniref:PTS glucose transporter subunit IIA n=1 Tax=Phytoactinopolyspora halotolerans TaxID=1981512 RepID=A0A6L9S9H8_9ACTN|nr:PTS glucose transporter subunit IIA [Phytoactinopolyspora halotolerans]NEE00610.1 PTS glucose transporter subunit IIA [Phytoactinopolyspora halotolerans]